MYRLLMGSFLAVALCLPGASPLAADGKTATLSIEPPVTPWRISDDERWIDFTVVIGGDGARQLRLLRSTLVDSSPGMGWMLPTGNLHLCLAKTTDPKSCPATVSVAAGRAMLWLAVDRDFDRNGVFVGNLEFDTIPPTETKTIALTVQQTSLKARFLGFALIVIGVAAAWLLLAYGRGRLARDQALLPAALLRQRALDLHGLLQGVPPKLQDRVGKTSEAIRRAIDALATAQLDAQQFLPSSIPMPGAAAMRVTEYQTFLQTQSRILDKLDVVLHEGVLRIAREVSPIPVEDRAFADLIEGIDKLGGDTAPDAAAVRTALAQLFGAWRSAHPTAAAVAVSATRAPQRELTPFNLLIEMRSIAITSWIVWGTLTALIGLVVLVLPSPGFGTAMDYVRCLLWGFGLPVAGQALQQITPSSLNAQLGITLPR